MKNLNIIWSAVIAVVLAVLSIIASIQENLTFATSLGLSSITAAILSSRESKK